MGGVPKQQFTANESAIAAIRVRLGWSQRRLATAVGVHPSLIAQLETGRCGVSDQVLKDIAREFGVPIESIVFVAEEAS